MILTLNLRPDVTVLAVPVEMNAHGFAIIGNVTLAYDYNGYTKKSLLLPSGSYELIGLLREFKDAEELAVLNTAIHSAGGDPKQNWLIIKKIA